MKVKKDLPPEILQQYIEDDLKGDGDITFSEINGALLFIVAITLMVIL